MDFSERTATVLPSFVFVPELKFLSLSDYTVPFCKVWKRTFLSLLA